MDTFAIIIDNKNYKKTTRYFLSVLINYNDYTWPDGDKDIEDRDIYDNPKLILGAKTSSRPNPFVRHGTLSYYNGDYSSLVREYDLKNIYYINKPNDIKKFITNYNIKNFDFGKYLSLIDENKNIIDLLYGKKKLVENIKKFKDF